MRTDVTLVGMDYETHVSFRDREDVYPESFVDEINGKILVYTEETDETCGGVLEAFYLDLLNAEFQGFDVLDIFDVSDKLYRFYSVLHDEDGNRKASSHNDDTTDVGNVLILDRIEVYDGFRGHGLAKAVVDMTVGRFARYGDLVVTQCFPLQFESKYKNGEKNPHLDLDSFEKDEEKAVKKLRSYYESIGFHSIDGEYLIYS